MLKLRQILEYCRLLILAELVGPYFLTISTWPCPISPPKTETTPASCGLPAAVCLRAGNKGGEKKARVIKVSTFGVTGD